MTGAQRTSSLPKAPFQPARASGLRSESAAPRPPLVASAVTRPRRRSRPLPGNRLQENQILHQRKCRRRQARASRKRNAHHRFLDHARARTARPALPFALSDRQSGIFGLLHALESMATLLLMCDRRDLGTAVGERPPSPGIETDGRNFPAPMNDPAETKRILRAESVSL